MKERTVRDKVTKCDKEGDIERRLRTGTAGEQRGGEVDDGREGWRLRIQGRLTWLNLCFQSNHYTSLISTLKSVKQTPNKPAV